MFFEWLKPFDSASEETTRPKVWDISMANSGPEYDGDPYGFCRVPGVSGTRRDHASFEISEAIPSLQPLLLSLLLGPSITPRTRSAELPGLAVFHTWRNWASCALTPSQFAPDPQKTPFKSKSPRALRSSIVGSTV